MVIIIRIVVSLLHVRLYPQHPQRGATAMTDYEAIIISMDIIMDPKITNKMTVIHIPHPHHPGHE
jgi:hypothetical protein